MSFDPKVHRRRSIRYRAYDYSQPGMYFVTVCTWDRGCLFGRVVGSEVQLSPEGKLVGEEWLKTPSLRPYVQLDAYLVMPNHFHGIIILAGEEEGTARCAPTRFGEMVHRSLPTIIRAFKSAVAKRVNQLHGTQGQPVWQRNYFEHIIRNDESLNQIRRYIANNPFQWHLDPENPDRKR